MHKNIFISFSFATILFFSSNAIGNNEDYGNDWGEPRIGIGIGYSSFNTPGAEFTMRFNDTIGFNYSFYGQDEKLNVGDENFSYEIYNRMVTVDYFPFNKYFYLSGGILVPKNDTSFEISKSNSLISDVEEILSIDGNISVGSGVSPYLGIGYKENNKKGIGYFVEAGVSFLKTDVELSPKYQNNDSSFDIESIEKKLNDQVDKNKVNYIFKAGLYYLF